MAAVGSCLFLYGGLSGGACRRTQRCLPRASVPLWPRVVLGQGDACAPLLLAGALLDDLLVAEDARADEGLVGDAVESLSAIADLQSPAWKASPHASGLRSARISCA